ncbi:tetratricopeptide repeat protein [Actinomadura sp. KC345]|uniref:tetratricopeptide repeat protein n=1 Tax=Actinomadura sp. KC345 TaxID=2530371 RepID=UPI0010476B4C|nr:tetratricopeptide repeat protein [Actinomadura sp. KC345]TDC43367.1 tetratricopeptide repeat protein [Actinomadura sp. KC345]
MDLEAVFGGGGLVVAATAAVIAWVQLRRTPALPAGSSQSGGGASRGILRPPTGRLPEHVRGREQVLRTIEAAARRPDGAIHLLGGLGGTGKTTIALRVADNCLSAGRRVWWVSGVDAGSLASELLELALALGATAQDIEDVSNGRRNPADLLWEFLETQRDWVLVIDNADDPDALAVQGRAAGDSSGWIRPSSSGLVLITSRNIDPMVWGRHVTVHTVGWLPAEQGARILLDLAPQAGSMDVARELSERLGGLPLALHHAGLHLASPFHRERSFTAYAEALEDRFPELMGAGADDRSIVTSTWRITLDALIGDGHPEAGALMRVLSCFAGGVPFRCDLLDHDVLARGCGLGDGARVAEGLRALANTGLISLSSSGGDDVITVHPLVAETLRTDDGDRRAHGGTATDLVATAAEGLDPRNPEHHPAWASLVPHVTELLQAATSWHGDSALERAAEAASLVAIALGWGSQYFAALRLVEKSLTTIAALGTEHPVVVELTLTQAKVTRLLGDPESAEPIVRRVVRTRESVLGPDDLDTLRARHELGLCLVAQDKITDAEQEYTAVLAARRNILGEDHPHTLMSRHVIAEVPARLGRPDEAERQHREIYSARLRILGPDHQDTLLTRKYIGIALVQCGRIDEAERELTEVLPALGRVLGGEHGHVLSVRYELASLLAARGRTRAARKELRELISVMRRVLGTGHPATRKAEDFLAGLSGGPA